MLGLHYDVLYNILIHWQVVYDFGPHSNGDNLFVVIVTAVVNIIIQWKYKGNNMCLF
jgi:hypothetical protein